MYRKEKFDPKEIESKIDLLKPFKVLSGNNGWDIKVARQVAQQILEGERKFPFYELGNKNFPREKEYRRKDEDEDDYYDQEYKYSGGDQEHRDYGSDYRPRRAGGNRYVNKGGFRDEQRDSRPSEATAEESEKPTSSEYEFKSKSCIK